MPEPTEPFETWTVAIDADTSLLQQELRDASALGRRFSTTLVSAFTSVAVKGKSLGDVFKSLALSLSQLVLKSALKPLGDAFGGVLAGLTSGGIGFAKGGVLQRRMPVPFASGGIIQSPVSFPLAGGRFGLAGERGAEAIMPLSRGPDGRLGVAARGAASVNVTLNVTTTDAESFRRSESQVAAMVARAAALGQRNL